MRRRLIRCRLVEVTDVVTSERCVCVRHLRLLVYTYDLILRSCPNVWICCFDRHHVTVGQYDLSLPRQHVVSVQTFVCTNQHGASVRGKTLGCHIAFPFERDGLQQQGHRVEPERLAHGSAPQYAHRITIHCHRPYVEVAIFREWSDFVFHQVQNLHTCTVRADIQPMTLRVVGHRHHQYVGHGLQPVGGDEPSVLQTLHTTTERTDPHHTVLVHLDVLHQGRSQPVVDQFRIAQVCVRTFQHTASVGTHPEVTLMVSRDGRDTSHVHLCRCGRYRQVSEVVATVRHHQHTLLVQADDHVTLIVLVNRPHLRIRHVDVVVGNGVGHNVLFLVHLPQSMTVRTQQHLTVSPLSQTRHHELR